MNSASTLLDAALEYRSRGWSLIPIRLDTKIPAVKWSFFQIRRASEEKLRIWFKPSSGYGLGVVFGSISGNLGARDFDDMAAYELWASQYPELAASLPTVRTHRGRHVYFQTDPQAVADFRANIGKADGTGAIPLDDGELRIGTGCYSLVPPSPHPKGGIYEWVVPLAAEIPVVTDFVASGLFPATYRDNRGLPMRTKDDGGHKIGSRERDETCVVSLEATAASQEATIELAIQNSLPTEQGTRNKQVFELARALKAIPGLADAPGIDLETIVRRWHTLALPQISTKPFEETWIEFLRGWPKVKYAKGEGPLNVVLKTAKARQADFANKYESKGVQLMESFCRELQRVTGDGPFYLSCRTAGKLLDAHYTSANDWLFLLAQNGALQVVERGSQQSRKATRYRYLGPM